MALQIQQEPNKSDKLNDKGEKRLLGHTRSVILACLAGAVLLPTAACADNKPSPPEAMIVDELGITDPNPDFLSETGGQLILNGYEVDYVPPESVLVDFYRELPKYNSNIIVIRSHSADATLIGNTVTHDIGLFTSQPYLNYLYVNEQRRGELFVALFFDRKQIPYFSIGPKFVENEMKGKFKKGSIVIVMGCNGLTNTSMAEAFFKKGVDTYFGFDGSVSAEYTDEATEILIQHLVVDHMTPPQAAVATAQEIGPDPVYGGKLLVLQKAQ